MRTVRSATRVRTARVGAPLRSQDLARLQSRYLQPLAPRETRRANFVRYVLKMVTEKSYKMMVEPRVKDEWKLHLPEVTRRNASYDEDVGLDPSSVHGVTGSPYGLLLVANVLTSNYGMGPTKARMLNDVKPAGIGLDPLDAMVHGFDEDSEHRQCGQNPGPLHWQRAMSNVDMVEGNRAGNHELFWIRGEVLEVILKPSIGELSALASSIRSL